MPVGRIELLGDARRVAQLERARRRRHEHELRHLARGTRRSAAAGCRAPTASRKPWSTSVSLRERSPSYMPPSWGTVWCDSSTKTTKSDGKKSSSVCGAEPGGRPSRMTRVVLDPVAEAELLHHLEVVLGALPHAGAPRASCPADSNSLTCSSSSWRICSTARSIVGFEVTYCVAGKIARWSSLRVDLAGQRVEVRDLLDLVAEERDPVRRLHVRRLHLDHVALDAELAAAEQRVVADVLDVDQLPQHEVAVVLLAPVRAARPASRTPRASRGRRCAETEATMITSRRESSAAVAAWRSRSMSSFRERVLLDVEVGLRARTPRAGSSRSRRRSTRPRCREELARTRCRAARRASCCGRSASVGPLHLLDDPRHRRRLAGSGRAEQRLEAVARLDSLGELGDRLRLVGRRRVRLRMF